MRGKLIPRGRQKQTTAASLSLVHVDMDAFYASVEQRDNPPLRGAAVVVGGSPEGRGVVSTCSYEARRYGIHSAMPSSRARALCPSAVFISPDFARYRQASEEVRSILRSAGEAIEVVGLDEAFVQLPADCAEPVQIARRLKREIKKECELDCSVGLSYNKPLAKLASEWNKPDGFMVIRQREAAELLAGIPMKNLWGIGPSTEETLRRRGIVTCSDFVEADAGLLIELLGAGRCWELSLICNGLRVDEVGESTRAKSVSREKTLAHDVDEPEELQVHLLGLAADLAERLSRKQVRGVTVVLKVRFSDFTTITRSRTMDEPVDGEDELIEVATELMDTVFEDAASEGVRLLGLGVSGLHHSDVPHQLSFL